MNEKELQAKAGVPEELNPALANPCSECPWRRKAWAGYLGPLTAENWIKAVMSDQPIQCHKTIEESENWEGTFQCKGAAQFRANVCKLPRRDDIETGPADRDTIFATPQEFIDHHKNSKDFK